MPPEHDRETYNPFNPFTSAQYMMISLTTSVSLLLFALAPRVAVLSHGVDYCSSVAGLVFDQLSNYDNEYNIHSETQETFSHDGMYTLSQCSITGHSSNSQNDNILKFDGTHVAIFGSDGIQYFTPGVSCVASFNGKLCRSCELCTPDGSSTTIKDQKVFYDCSGVDESHTCVQTKEQACGGDMTVPQSFDDCVGGDNSAASSRARNIFAFLISMAVTLLIGIS